MGERQSPMGGPYFAQGERDGAGLSPPRPAEGLGALPIRTMPFLIRPSAGGHETHEHGTWSFSLAAQCAMLKVARLVWHVEALFCPWAKKK